MKKIGIFCILISFFYNFFACDTAPLLPPIESASVAEENMCGELSRFAELINQARCAIDAVHVQSCVLKKPGMLEGDELASLDRIIFKLRDTTNATNYIQRMVLMICNELDDVRYKKVNHFGCPPVERSEQEGGGIQLLLDRFSENIYDASNGMYWIVPFVHALLRMARNGGDVPYRVDRWSRDVRSNHMTLQSLCASNQELVAMVHSLQRIGAGHRKRSGSCPRF